MKNDSKQESSRRCPYCDEPIRKNAKKCRFCGEWLNNTKQEQSPNPDYTRIFLLVWIVTLLAFFGIMAAANYDFSTAPDYLGILLGIDILLGIASFIFFFPKVLSLLLYKKSQLKGVTYLAITLFFFFGFFFALNKLPSNYSPPATKETNQPVVKATPKPTPKSSEKPTVATTKEVNTKTTNTSATTSPNTPVHCNIHPNCGGGTTPLTKAECDNSVCCEVEPDKWVFMKDKSQCNNDGPSTSSNNSKMVPFTTTEATVNGTYYCYEDRVNDLTKMENIIKIMSVTANTCKTTNQMHIDNCVRVNCSVDNPNWTVEWSSECIDKCYESSNECIKDYEELGNKRKEYMELIYKICP